METEPTSGTINPYGSLTDYAPPVEDVHVTIVREKGGTESTIGSSAVKIIDPSSRLAFAFRLGQDVCRDDVLTENGSGAEWLVTAFYGIKGGEWGIAQVKQKTEAKESPTEEGQAPDFLFIQAEPQIRDLLKRDYIEIQRCLRSECWKAAIILCGSSLEATLFDVLKHNEQQALGSSQKGKGKIEKWHFEEYINVATDLQIISKGVQCFSHSLRDYRNLVHPLKEIQGNYKIAGEEARAAFEALKMVIRDL